MDKKDPAYLAGKILLAMPTLGDPRFERAVIFLCAHDANGAMGLVVNRHMPGMDFGHLLRQLGLDSDIRVDLPQRAVPVMYGGPVEESRGFLLHSPEFAQKDTIRINDAISVTATVDALREVADGKGPEKLLFVLGYAGWAPGQLEAELKQNAWLVDDPDPSIIFHDVTEEKWRRAVDRLGIDPAMLSSESGRA